MNEFDDPPYQSPAERLADGLPAEGTAEGTAGGAAGDAAASSETSQDLSDGGNGGGGGGGDGDGGGGGDVAGQGEPPAQDPPVDVPPEQPFEQLHNKVVIYWLLSGLVGWFFLFVFTTAGALAVYFKLPDIWIYVWPPATALLSLLLAWTIISPSLAYSRWHFRVDSELLIARYGIFFLEEKAIPISRLQHVDLYRGLLERFFGLTTLIVFTAGTEGAHFRLPGLSVDRARQLRDLILAARGDDVI